MGEDINLIQYPIEQAGQSRSVVMCRLYRSPGDGQWSIQALGSEEWYIAAKVCMAYANAKAVIDADLKVMKEEETKGDGDEEGGDGDVVEIEEAQPEGDEE